MNTLWGAMRSLGQSCQAAVDHVSILGLRSLSLGILGLGSLGVSGVLHGCAIVQPPSAAAEAERIMVRAINLVPNSPPLSLSLADEANLGVVTYGEVSDYVRLPGGRYDVSVWAPEVNAMPLLASLSASGLALSSVNWMSVFDDNAVPQATLSQFWADLSASGSFSILAVDEVSRVSSIVLKDGQRPVFDRALVRFVHAVPDGPPLQWVDTSPNPARVDGTVVESLAFGGVSNYVELQPGFQSLLLKTATVEPGLWTDRITISNGGQDLTRFNFDVRANRVYTVFITGLLRGSPSLDVVLTDDTDVSLVF